MVYPPPPKKAPAYDGWEFDQHKIKRLSPEVSFVIIPGCPLDVINFVSQTDSTWDILSLDSCDLQIPTFCTANYYNSTGEGDNTILISKALRFVFSGKTVAIHSSELYFKVLTMVVQESRNQLCVGGGGDYSYTCVYVGSGCGFDDN